MSGLEHVRDYLAEYLRGQGVNAVTAWPDRPRSEEDGAVCAVSLRKGQAVGVGFCDYLGERYDTERGRWVELYGKRVRLTFGLDLYAPAGAEVGESAIRAAFDTLAGALQGGGPAGLKLEEFSCGETEFLETEGRYRCPVEAAYQAFLYAVADEGGSFLDFEVKGVMQH